MVPRTRRHAPSTPRGTSCNVREALRPSPSVEQREVCMLIVLALTAAANAAEYIAEIDTGDFLIVLVDPRA